MSSLNFTFWKFLEHSAELKFHDFSITQILREINFGDCTSAKSAILSYFKALDEFLFLWIFAFFKVECSFDTIQRLKNGKKTAVLRNYYILQNWFHVKSEGQKNPEFSTLWTLYKCTYLIWWPNLFCGNFLNRIQSGTSCNFSQSVSLNKTLFLHYFHEIF